MKNYDFTKIRNLAFVGSSGAGKTTLIEMLLNKAKMTTRIGKVEDGNTVMDFDQEEINKTMSLTMGVGYLNWEGKYLNIIDTPGYADYIGEQIAALSAVETAMVVANATGGFEVGLEFALDSTTKAGISRALIINRMDNEQADYNKIIEDIAENTGINVTPLIIPIGKEAGFKGVVDILENKAYIDGQFVDIPAEVADEVEESRMKLMESVAETSEELMEKYFEEGELSVEEMITGVKAGIISGDVMPAFACSATMGKGLDALLKAICSYLPSPADKAEFTMLKGEEEVTKTASPDGEFIGYVFKSFSDPAIGDMAYLRVMSGTLKSGTEVFVTEKNSKDRVGNMYFILGKNRKDASELKAGMIGGLVKMKAARGLNTLVEPNSEEKIPAPEMPAPVYWKSIKAASQADEDKIGGALNKLLDEDPTITAKFDSETHENVLSGVGEQQMQLIQKRLKSRYKVEAELFNPRIPYKETIMGKTDVQYKHKKQSGGRGQYGHVHFKIGPKPRGEGFEFINSIVGGVIPSKFIPAIEKGLVEIMGKGVIAGYQVVDLYVDCYYGSYHDVDSSEMAFKIAASQALKLGFNDCKPILLEPIHNVNIVIPNEYMGDVMGDISTRRGKIVGMEQVGNKQHLNAQLPLSELFEYFPSLKSLTQGRGRFTQEFSHYERLPQDNAQKVIAEFQQEDE